MTVKTNTFEGGTNGSAVAAAGSGGTSGDAFSSVTISSPGTLVYDNAQAAHGVLSAKLTGGGASGAVAVYYDFTASGAVAVRVYFYFTALPTADHHLISMQTVGGATRLFSIHINGASKLRIADASGTTGVWTAANTVPLNQWICVQMYAAPGSTTSNGVAKGGVYLGDSTTPIEAIYSSTTANLGAGQTIGRVVIGKTNTSTFATAYWLDDIKVDDAATDLLGPVVAVPAATIKPASVVSNSGGWTNQGAGASIAAALADTDDATFVRSAGATTNEVITLGMTGPLSAGNVTVPYRARLAPGSAATQVKVELLEGATVRAVRTQTLTSSWANYSMDLTTGENAAISDRTALTVRLTGNPV